MASLRQRLPANVAGDFFVDATCIDCETCRWLAPDTFVESQGQSAVYRQPQTEDQHYRALMAVLACPVAGSNRPKAPCRWAVYQTVPSGAGATSCGPEPAGTGK